MATTTKQQLTRLERFQEAQDRFAALPQEAKNDWFRRLGILSADGRLTTRYGGEGEVDTEAVNEEWERVQAAFAAAR